MIAALEKAFAEVELLYIADGHHRSAAAARVCEQYQTKYNSTGKEAYNYFLAVIFPDKMMNIMAYNRVVADLNGLSEQEFFAKIKEHFSIVEYPRQFEPKIKLEFGMYINHQWYKLTPKGQLPAENEVDKLDVSILQNLLLGPVLGIADPRTDTRISFVGGKRGLSELERLVDSGEGKLAFALYPTAIGELLAIADNGQVMPPKSTWFEPKLRDAMVIHLINE
jgi:uncharacterized protein (DUF1015 family)